MEKPVLVVEIDSVTGDVMRVPLQVDRVRYDRELGVIPSFVTPPAIDLRFERRGTARLPVTVDIRARPAAGYTVMMPIEVNPETVTVRGPASWLDSLTRVTTRHVALDELSNTVIRDIPLALPEGVEGARADPPSVLVTISLDSLVVRRRRVPILLRGAGASRARVEPDSVTVEVRGAAGPVDARLAALGGITVTVTEVPTAPFAVALQVDAGEGGPAAVSLTPATATIGPAR
jgi:YbbR domain-containing protein